jgi:phosphatidate cytidylyltransferase
MLVQRVVVAILLIPLGVFVIMTGGWLLTAVAVVVLGYASLEYYRIFHKGGYQPSAPVLIAGVTGLVLFRQFSGFTGSDLVFSLVILLAMATQVLSYEKGDKTAAVDFNITLGGILYLGWLGAYIISVRNLPNGVWWLLLVLPASWLCDGAAYFIGRRFGRHKMSPRVSPKKSWEGYLAGIVGAALGTMLLAALWNLRAPEINLWHGLIIGIVVAVITPLGDLGESMLKREFGVKDSGHVLPGHGGILDRIDSWLWAAAVGYYLIVWVFL